MTTDRPTGAAVPLRDSNLAAIHAKGVVRTPGYDRDGVTAGIVHFGVGGFHRSHLAMLVDRLLASGEARDFGICGVGLLEQDRRMAQVMADQDNLYTLVLKHSDGSREPRVIGSIVDYLFAPDDREAVVERMARPEVRIVSMTRPRMMTGVRLRRTWESPTDGRSWQNPSSSGCSRTTSRPGGHPSSVPVPSWSTRWRPTS
jgi:mannitol 2-dehydrogenase